MKEIFMRVIKQILVSFLLCQLQDSVSWQPANSLLCRQQQRLLVVSGDLDEVDTQENEDKVPYVVARGDGSTGGGGLPMPRMDEESGLTRPKVGAEMPEG